MDEARFRQKLRDAGYGEPAIRAYPPGTDGPLHTHDESVMLLVLDGEFTLAGEAGVQPFGPGEVCELAAGVPHAERTGAAGARVLLAKKRV